MELKDKITGYSRYKLNKIKGLVMDYCVSVLGYKKSNGISGITLSYRDNDSMGMYDPIEHHIYIYMKELDNIEDLVSTIIHEYTHSVQNVLRSYTKMYKKYGYDNHPMEIEARENEVKYSNLCMEYVKTRW